MNIPIFRISLGYVEKSLARRLLPGKSMENAEHFRPEKIRHCPVGGGLSSTSTSVFSPWPIVICDISLRK